MADPAVDKPSERPVIIVEGLGLERISTFVVRVVSLHQNLAAYKRNDMSSLDQDFNIEKLRVAMAKKICRLIIGLLAIQNDFGQDIVQVVS